ncbi:hypothetical protein [Actinomyces succiniciruminis]|uniref:Uncharacterized protein n=1 Tax=Actinomyces succiniciruminis TaxID=1522002 RepID=A0A1L7RHY2_9ACTO|nr:hypothetical protein [Actinomyces succiniciruminis]CED91316.1 Hypothetical protein AAM4_1484 [Actinomyces succiniciruminis]
MSISNTNDAGDALDKAIALASSPTIMSDDMERMTAPKRLGYVIELTGQAIRDRAHEGALLATIASIAMQWAGDVVEGSDPPHWARQTALQDADDAQATRLARASHLTASVAHLAKIIADEDAASADQLGTALINAAVAALAWLTDNIHAGANVDVPRPASDDYLARVSEEILSILDQSPTLRNLDADPFALPDLAEAITDQLDMGGWLTPPLPTDPRTQEHTA